MKIQGARIITLGSYSGPNGGNTHLDFNELPFVPRRIYTVHGVGAGMTRGHHAHRVYTQLMMVVAGSCRMSLDDARVREDVMLSKPWEALLVPPLVFTIASDFAPGTVLTVLSSGPYEKAEFVNSLEELAALRAGAR